MPTSTPPNTNDVSLTQFELLAPLSRQEQAIAEALIGYRFKRPEWLALALTHSSATTAQGLNNERIEFLGDSILGLVVAEYLIHTRPTAPEGDLTRFRSMVVNTHTLAKVMRSLMAFVLDSEYRQVFTDDSAVAGDLVHEGHGTEDSKLLRRISMRALLRLGRGIPANKELPSRIWANMFEAIVGAIYLDSGLAEARDFVLRMLDSSIAAVTAPGIETNHKSLLQHVTQKYLGGAVRYQIIGQSGPDHEKVFEIQVKILDYSFPAARGKSKREAEQAAANLALTVLAADWETHVVNGLQLPEELLLYLPSEPATVAAGDDLQAAVSAERRALAAAIIEPTSEGTRRGPVVRLEPHRTGATPRVDAGAEGVRSDALRVEGLRPESKTETARADSHHKATAKAQAGKASGRRKKSRSRRKR